MAAEIVETSRLFARTVAAILETYQRADGTIDVPDVLRGYLRRDRIEPVADRRAASAGTS